MHNNETMTLQEATNFLNVPETYLLKLIQEGNIPSVRIETQQRVYKKDIMNYKEKQRKKRRQELNQLTEFLQDNGFYD